MLFAGNVLRQAVDQLEVAPIERIGGDDHLAGQQAELTLKIA